MTVSLRSRSPEPRGRRRALAALGALAAALVAVALPASPASAATGTINGYSINDDGTMSVSFSANDLPQGTTIDPASVTVTLAGQTVPGTSAKPASGSDITRVTFLTIDTSGSMRGEKMASAKAAANAYLDQLPPDVAVGLVSFSNTPTLQVPATTDRATVKAAVDALEPRQATSLRDAILLSIQNLGTTGIRSQLVLADGGDGRSQTTLEDTVKQIAASGTIVDAVSIGGTEDEKAQLDALVKAGNGVVVDATGTAEIVDAFTAAADAENNAVVVTVPIPQGVTGSQPLAVSASAGTETVDDSIVALIPAGSAPTPDPTEQYAPQASTVDAGIFGQGWLLPAALVALGIGLFVLLAVAFLGGDEDSRTQGRVRRRLSRYSLTSREPEPQVQTSGALGQGAVARSAVELAGRVTQKRDIDNVLGTRLEAAGVPLKPPEWLLIHIGSTIVLGLLFMLLSGFGWLATLIGLLIGFLIPFFYLRIKEERRKAAFQAALPDTLQLLAGSLAAGYSLPQAVDTVTRESSGPMAVELNKAIVEARLGVPMEDALDTIARRMNSVDFAWVVMAIRIQREVGGNLSEVLNSVAATMRERERLRRQVEVLSAEGRLSAVILGLLPVLFIVYLTIARPEYLSTLITTPLGLVMCVVGLVLLIVGAFWLRKVVKVEV
ncbi:MAG: type II secretion system F family protein [Actinobacteria bacterium]|nr:type II secretion system F family protein [Actinomycetota bacterium]